MIFDQEQLKNWLNLLSRKIKENILAHSPNEILRKVSLCKLCDYLNFFITVNGVKFQLNFTKIGCKNFYQRFSFFMTFLCFHSTNPSIKWQSLVIELEQGNQRQFFLTENPTHFFWI